MRVEFKPTLGGCALIGVQVTRKSAWRLILCDVTSDQFIATIRDA